MTKKSLSKSLRHIVSYSIKNKNPNTLYYNTLLQAIIMRPFIFKNFLFLQDHFLFMNDFMIMKKKKLIHKL